MAGEWNFNSNQFVVDYQSTSVGIGTNDPTTKLEVVGTASISGALTLNNLTYTFPSTQTSNYFLRTNGSGTFFWAQAATGKSITSNSIDFDEFVASMSLDSNWDVAVETVIQLISHDANFSLGMDRSLIPLPVVDDPIDTCR